MWKTGIAGGDVRLFRPDAKFDYISSWDISKVSGTILAKVLDKELVVSSISKEESVKTMIRDDMPEFFTK